MAAIFRAWYNGSYTIAAKPIKSLELRYTMIQFLAIIVTLLTLHITNEKLHLPVPKFKWRMGTIFKFSFYPKLKSITRKIRLILVSLSKLRLCRSIIESFEKSEKIRDFVLIWGTLSQN